MVAGINLSTDGKRLALLKGFPQSDGCVAKLEEHGARIGEPQRLTLDYRQDFPPDWTRDDKAVIFASDLALRVASGRANVWMLENF